MRSLYPWPTFPSSLEPSAKRSLSLLFILQQWLFSFKCLEEVQISLSQLDPPSFLERIEKFLLFSLERPFSQQAGYLDKLCFYSEILIKASSVCEETLSQTLEEMRRAILAFKKAVMKKDSPLSAEPSELCHCLTEKLRTCFSSFLPFLQEAKSNENVLLYLLEHRHEINDFLGTHVIEKLLQRFFPFGPIHMRAILCEAFTRRGFLSFYCEKEELIEGCKWE